MLDTFTLRVVFAVVAACALILFYRATYQPTRSRYAGWWCVALLAFGISPALFLFNGTDAQVIANPMGSVFGVLGAVCVWASARSLLQRDLPWWVFVGLPAVTAGAAFADDPAHDIWAGGFVFLFSIAIVMAGAAMDMTTLTRRVLAGTSRGSDDPQYRASVVSMAVVAWVFSVYYLARTIAYAVVGPHSDFFDDVLGGETTTMVNIVLLAVTIFSMSALSRAQYIDELRTQATHDDLTGLLNRGEFMRQAAAVAGRRTGGPATVLVVADLDSFKRLNDSHGHAAGDRALAAVGSICRRHLRPGEFAGRLGGDEFAMVLTQAARAYDLAGTLNAEVGTVMGDGIPATISFGMADLVLDVTDSLERADRALYEAKAGGGSRIVADTSAG